MFTMSSFVSLAITGFIKADCYASDDLFALGSEQAVKEKGLLRSEGKEYVVKDGDILFFKFNV